MVNDIRNLKIMIRMSLLLVELDIIAFQKLDNDQFQLIAGEESAGTGVLSISFDQLE